MTDSSASGPGGSSPRPGPRSTQRRLMRSRTDKQIGGVAGGIGRYFGVDPVLIRVGFVLLALAGGGGFALYAVCWLLLPEDDGTQTVPSERMSFSDTPVWARVGLIAGGVLLISTRIFDGGSSFWWGVLLIGAGVLLFRDDERRQSRAEEEWPSRPHAQAGSSSTGPAPSTAHPGSPAGGTPSAGAGADEPKGRSSYASSAAETDDLGAPGVATEHEQTWDASSWAPANWETDDLTSLPPPEPWPVQTSGATAVHPVRRHSVLGRLTVAVAAMVVGSAAFVDRLGGTDLNAMRALSLALLVVGIGCLVGSVAGRGRGLIGLGLLLTPMLVFSSTVSVPAAEFGDMTVRPATVSQLADPIELGVGDLLVDLRGLETSASSVPVEVRQGAGQLEILLPAGAGVDLDARVAAGEIRIEDAGAETFRAESGLDVTSSYGTSAEPGQPVYALDVELGAGEILLQREAG